MKFSTTVNKQLCEASVCNKSLVLKKRKSLAKAKNLEQITHFSKIISDPTRARIVYLLYTNEALCVCDIANIIDISIASASQHLRKMKNLNLVTSAQQKNNIFYYISNYDFKIFLKNAYLCLT